MSCGLRSLKAADVHGQISLKIACGTPWGLSRYHPLPSLGHLYHFRSLWTRHREGQREFVLCTKLVPIFFEEFCFSLGQWGGGVGNSHCYMRSFCCRPGALFCTCGSQTWACIRSPARLVQNRSPPSPPESLIQQGLRICISNSFPTVAVATGPGPYFGNWCFVLWTNLNH